MSLLEMERKKMSSTQDRPKTLVEKVWERHVVRSAEEEPDLLYVDLHLVHEVTSPQAFEGLRLAGRKVRRPDLTYATMDHNVPTSEFGSADRRQGLREADGGAGEKLRGVRVSSSTSGAPSGRGSSTSSVRRWA